MELRVISVLYATFVCKIRVAEMKGYHGFLWYPSFLECSVEQQNDLKRAGTAGTILLVKK